MLCPFLPKIRGRVDDVVEHEIVKAFNAMYDDFQKKLEEIKKQSSRALGQVEEIKSSGLFSGALANPLLTPTSAGLAEVAQQGQVIDVGQVPNLPASKIASGNLAIARHAGNILKTDDALFEDVTGAPNINTGKLIIKDNAGHTIKVMTCA